MIKYREHRGSLQESLETTREFSTLKDCLQYVQGNWNERPGNSYARLDDIQISYYGYDDRVKQELFQVYLKPPGFGDLRHYMLGFIYEKTI
jgi:hypothetical protein